MDLDGDGRLDIFSGSYPGHLYLFRGTEDGGFAASMRVKDADGEEINVGRAAAVYAGDWDTDGDVDLLVGDIKGHVWWIENASGSSELKLGEGVKLKVGEDEIKVPGGDAGPVLADWDGNGTVDLLVGCGDGSVRLYSNGSGGGAPTLTAHEDLVPKSRGMSIKAGQSRRCGTRAKVCVTDWNGDGQLDLLVGDVLMERIPPPAMTAEEEAKQARAQKVISWVQERYGPAMQRVQKRAFERLGIEVGEKVGREVWNGLTEEQRDQFSSLYQEEMKKDVEAAALSRLMQTAFKSMRRYQGENRVHGHVWVRLRDVG